MPGLSVNSHIESNTTTHVRLGLRLQSKREWNSDSQVTVSEQIIFCLCFSSVKVHMWALLEMDIAYYNLMQAKTPLRFVQMLNDTGV